MAPRARLCRPSSSNARRHDAFKTGIVAHASVFGRHVQIDANQNPLTLGFETVESAKLAHDVKPKPLKWICLSGVRDFPRKDAGLKKRMAADVSPGHYGIYSSLPIATAVSLMRFEKPHSLSYQARTRTSLPP